MTFTILMDPIKIQLQLYEGEFASFRNIGKLEILGQLLLDNLFNFCTVCWIEGIESLLNHADLSMVNLSQNFIDFVDSKGKWNWIALYYVLPHHICSMITIVLPPSSNHKLDLPIYLIIKSQHFSIKYACLFWRQSCTI